MRGCLVLVFLISSCASRSYVSQEYSNIIRSQNDFAVSKKTVVLFLVDGLSHRVLDQQLKSSQLPQIARHFLSSGQGLLKAHSVFPSLTYTNIASLLHEQPLHQTGAFGNKMFYKGQFIDFESLGDRESFAQRMRENNIFTRLTAKKAKSVSLDYRLGVDATVSSDFDFQSGYAVSQTDYAYLDRKKIESLKLLLTENKPAQWPEFIFVHLIGVDLLSHKYGPQAIEVKNYLKSLDTDLKSVFVILKNAEKKKTVVTMLTADHGFSLNAQNYVNIEALAARLEPAVKVINEGRMASLYFKMAPSESQLVKAAEKILSEKNVEIVAFKKGSRVQVKSHGLNIYFDYVKGVNCHPGYVAVSVGGGLAQCSNQIAAGFGLYPFFLENLTSYFNSDQSPEVVVIPSPRTNFYAVVAGSHGGPTEEEVITPLLMRNARLANQAQILPIWQLLQFVD